MTHVPYDHVWWQRKVRYLLGGDRLGLKSDVVAEKLESQGVMDGFAALDVIRTRMTLSIIETHQYDEGQKCRANAFGFPRRKIPPPLGR